MHLNSYATVFRDITQRFPQRVSLGRVLPTSITVSPEMYAITCVFTFDKSHEVSHSSDLLSVKMRSLSQINTHTETLVLLSR